MKKPHKKVLTKRTLALKRQFAQGGLSQPWNPTLNPVDTYTPEKENSFSPRASGQAQKKPDGSIDYEHYGEGPEQLFLGDRAPPQISLAPRTDKFVPKNPSSGSDNSYILPVLGLAAAGGKDLYDLYRDQTGPANSHIGGTGSVADTEAWNDAQLQGIEAPDGSALPGWWDAVKGSGQAGLGALGLYGGVKQGGTEGAASALSGASDISGALDKYGYGAGSYGDAAGGAGDFLSGINEGGVKGYGQAAVGGAEVADAFGYDQFGNYVPILGGLLGAYNGLQSGDPGGYASTVGGLYSAANAAGVVAAPAAAGTMAAGSGAAGALGAFGTAAPYAAAGFAIANAANHALGVGKQGGILEAYRDSIGAKQVVGADAIRAARANGQTDIKGGKIPYIQLPDGRVIKEDEFTRMYNEAGSPYGRWAQGGSVSNEGIMNRRPMGGLSVLAPRIALDDPHSYYRYGKPPAPAQPMPADPRRMPNFLQPSPLQRAMGGGIGFGYNGGGSPAELVRGPGSGRSDDIPARLSDGEYIMDAETVALLGDGSTDEGARRLDAMRKKLRMHKGKELSKGKFSSAAKAPEKYLGE